jgi:hypothetical protein
MMTHRFTKFATAAVVATALGLGGLAAAATASAETCHDKVVVGPNGGKVTAHCYGSENGSGSVHWMN